LRADAVRLVEEEEDQQGENGVLSHGRRRC
jgi:hypothetical protein